MVKMFLRMNMMIRLQILHVNLGKFQSIKERRPIRQLLTFGHGINRVKMFHIQTPQTFLREHMGL